MFVDEKVCKNTPTPPLLYHTRKGMLPYLKIFFSVFFFLVFLRKNE
nr:MAG TPA: hypothetical protein [Caudoviricetes sp.]